MNSMSASASKKLAVNLLDIQIDSVGIFSCTLQTILDGVPRIISGIMKEAEIVVDSSKTDQVIFRIIRANYNFLIVVMLSSNRTPLFSSNIKHFDVQLVYDKWGLALKELMKLRLHLLESFSGFHHDELVQIRKLNPLLTYYSAYFQSLQISLKEINLVIREHLLLEKMNLVYALISLGLRPENCFFIAKEDMTLYSIKVADTLKKLGVNVIRNGHVNSICDDIASHFSGKRVVVVDDGGDLIISLSNIAEKEGMKLFCAETTSKGIKIVQTYSKVNVVDLANSSIKVEQSKNIAVSAVIRLRDILCHENLANRNCNVIGYGKIGQYMASLLREMGIKVSVTEVSEERRDVARSHGFDVFPSLKDALIAKKYTMIVGCSGVKSFAVGEIPLLGNQTYFATISSQDFKLLIEFLQENSSSVNNERVGDVYKYANKTFTMLAHGHAVNLHLSEGVSEPEYDDFTALMYIATIQLAILSSQMEFIGEAQIDVEALCHSIREIQELIYKEEY